MSTTNDPLGIIGDVPTITNVETYPLDNNVYEFPDELSPAVVSRAIEDYHQFQTAGFILLF